MEVKFVIQYHVLVAREDIPRLSTEWKIKIRKAIETKLTTHPEAYGKPLRKSLAGYRKLRVGDYRAIFRVEETMVKVFVIQHRSVVYKKAEKRV